MNTNRIRTLIVVCSFLAVLGPNSRAQGPLTPPGPPAPTMKTLDQVEPRRPISSLPFFINQPGSYYLTGNLTGNPGGITIDASGVTLDLMGFELVGGVRQGIIASAVSNVVIRNGSVRGWESHGISTSQARGVLLERITSVGNTLHGIFTGDDSTIRRCTVVDNGGAGIFVGGGSLVENSSALRNGSYGFAMTTDSVVRECMATQNIQAGVSSNGSGNHIEANHVSGSVRGIDIVGVSNLIIRNSTKDCHIPYDIGAGNSVGGIANVSGTSFTNDNPWVNFNY